MLESAEPGFSIDLGENAGEDLRNACTEVTSRDSDDICNLGSINMGRVGSLSEFRDLVELGTTFLLAGTIYSDLPYYDVDKIRTKNRRLGLGLMGVHEWLLQRGKRYGRDEELALWLEVYRDVSRETATRLAKEWGISNPVKVRAIAPTGTISIVAETTSGIEPLFCAAYKRRYLKGGRHWAYQHIVDPVAKRLVDQGVKPENIEDAYSISEQVERRVDFQAFVQEYVDHGISSTINMPHWGSEWNNENKVKDFGNMLIKYLPKLRGITCYPDGSRGGQPLTPVAWEEALADEGIERIESVTDVCVLTKGGTCGD
jgi:ribonucleoside-diphosphate reductase alpha chain